VKLEQQVLSQYTSMAAYATIARQDVDSTKAESRSDRDRSQATLIGLLEKLSSEVNIRRDGLERRSSGGDLSGDAGARLSRLEEQLASAMEALQLCVRENQELRAQVADLVEHRMREQGWLVSGAPQALSLR
jgi:hypothetical protein